MTNWSSAREEIVLYAQRCVEAGLLSGTAGNLSIRLDEAVAITPSGIAYGAMSAEDIVIMDSHGDVIEGELLPSSEWQLHLAAYAQCGAGAVVHTHSPYATAVSSLVETLPPMHYYVAHMGGPVSVAPYATFGSPELARNVGQALRGRFAALMQNHGAVTIGNSLDAAFNRAVMLEWLAQVYCIAAPTGSPRLLSKAELEDVVQAQKRLREQRESRSGWRR